MKKRKGLSLLLSFALLLTTLTFAITAQAVSFSGGNGTETDPYRISNIEELKMFRDYVNAENGAGEYFKLTNNIDLGGSANPWTAIGNYYVEFFRHI